MTKNYKILTEKAQLRANPDRIALEKGFIDELRSVSYSDVLSYISTAMMGVDPEYTKKSREAGDRVKTHLDGELTETSYQYQGSVMTNTHIRGYSDIDLLAISERFYSRRLFEINDILNTDEKKNRYSTSQVQKLLNESRLPIYSGNYLEDLKQLRFDCERILQSKYSICNTGNPKAIKIKNTSLNREVDVVISNWYDDAYSVLNDKGEYRGIEIYNKERHATESPDYPFLSIKRINDRGAITNGRLKRMIRFLKTCKADSDQIIDLSSYFINAICYDIDPIKYSSLHYSHLVGVIYLQIKSICDNPSHASRVCSVDGREYVFIKNPDRLTHLQTLLQSIQQIYIDLFSSGLLIS